MKAFLDPTSAIIMGRCLAATATRRDQDVVGSSFMFREASLSRGNGYGEMNQKDSCHISSLSSRQTSQCPTMTPPKYPQALRHASQKRNADQEVNKPATWVISHLCHNKLCVNPISLTWEPSWFNRLRDNWPAGDACTHRLRPCLKPRQTIGPVMDWTEYI